MDFYYNAKLLRRYHMMRSEIALFLAALLVLAIVLSAGSSSSSR
jgi:hypothetical protein